MPQMRKLTPEEVLALHNKGKAKGPRKLVEEQYDAVLSEYSIGEYGEAVLESEDNRQTVRNRLQATAKRREVDLKFWRTNEDLIRFQVNSQLKRTPSTPTPTESAALSTPAKRKGGRPKKTV